MLDSEIPAAESLTIEFKSDRKRLPDTDLLLAAVCLANTDGGVIYWASKTTDSRPDCTPTIGI
jgi:ATP-dependent DNA helicase RecG